MPVFSMLGSIWSDISDTLKALPHYLPALVNLIFILLYQIFRAICFVCYFAEYLFKIFAGMGGSISLGGNNMIVENDLLIDFLKNPQIINAFWIILGFSVVMLVIFTIIAVIKSEFTTDLSKSAKTPIIGRAFKALANFVLVPVFMLLAVVGVNVVTKTIYNLNLGSNEQSYIITQCFEVGAYNANRARQADGENFAKFLAGKLEDTTNGLSKPIMGDTNIFKEAYEGNRGDSDKTATERVANVIDECFFSNHEHTDYKKNGEYVISSYKYTDYTLAQLTQLEEKGYAPWQILMFAQPDAKSKDVLPMQDVSLVNFYYDLSKFDFVLAIGSAVIIAWNLFLVALGLIKRLFELIILFVVSPAVVSMAPLDGGNALKTWRTEVTKRVLAVIAPVLAFNIYFIVIAPIIKTIDIYNVVNTATGTGNFGVTLGTQAGTGLLATTSVLPMLNSTTTWVLGATLGNLANVFFRVIALAVGIGLLKTANSWFTSFIGAGDLIGDGNAIMSKATKPIKNAALLATGAAAVGMGAFKGTAQALRGAFRSAGGALSQTTESKELGNEKLAIEQLDAQISTEQDPDRKKELEEKRNAHQQRADELRQKIKSGDVHSSRLDRKMHKGEEKIREKYKQNEYELAEKYNNEALEEDHDFASEMSLEDRLKANQEAMEQELSKYRTSSKVGKKQESYNNKYKNYAEKGGSFASSFGDSLIPTGISNGTGKVKGAFDSAKDKVTGSALGKSFGDLFGPKSTAFRNIAQAVSDMYGGDDSAFGKAKNLLFSKKGRESLYRSGKTIDDIKKAKDKAKEQKEKDEAAASHLEEVKTEEKLRQEARDEMEAEKEGKEVEQYVVDTQLSEVEANKYNQLKQQEKFAKSTNDTKLAQSIAEELGKFFQENDLSAKITDAKKGIFTDENKNAEFQNYKATTQAKATTDALNKMLKANPIRVQTSAKDETESAKINAQKVYESINPLVQDILNGINSFADLYKRKNNMDNEEK